MYKLEVADLTYYGIRFKMKKEGEYKYSRFIFNTREEAEQFSKNFNEAEIKEFDLARLIKK